jgi:hypothetical protein
MPPPRPKTPAPLLPKQQELIDDLWEHLKQSHAAAGDFKSRAPTAKKELEEVAKVDPTNTRAAVLAKLANSLGSGASRVQNVTQAFSKQIEKLISAKITYAAFKTEAKKVELEHRSLLVYADKYNEIFKATDFAPKKQFSKLTNVHCETWMKRTGGLEKLIDKL